MPTVNTYDTHQIDYGNAQRRTTEANTIAGFPARLMADLMYLASSHQWNGVRAIGAMGERLDCEFKLQRYGFLSQYAQYQGFSVITHRTQRQFPFDGDLYDKMKAKKVESTGPEYLVCERHTLAGRTFLTPRTGFNLLHFEEYAPRESYPMRSYASVTGFSAIGTLSKFLLWEKVWFGPWPTTDYAIASHKAVGKYPPKFDKPRAAWVNYGQSMSVCSSLSMYLSTGNPGYIEDAYDALLAQEPESRRQKFITKYKARTAACPVTG